MDGSWDMLGDTSELFNKCAVMMTMLELNRDTIMMLEVSRDKEAADQSPLHV